MAGAKRGGGGGREKGKREGSACTKSLCFCIMPTNFLVIRLHLLSIKFGYTRHCRKTLHSRTKEIRTVIQIKKALWRKLESLFSHNKKSFTLQKRSPSPQSPSPFSLPPYPLPPYPFRRLLRRLTRVKLDSPKGEFNWAAMTIFPEGRHRLQ